MIFDINSLNVLRIQELNQLRIQSVIKKFLKMKNYIQINFESLNSIKSYFWILYAKIYKKYIKDFKNLNLSNYNSTSCSATNICK